MDFVEEAWVGEGKVEDVDVDEDGPWDETLMKEGEFEINSYCSFSSRNAMMRGRKGG